MTEIRCGAQVETPNGPGRVISEGDVGVIVLTDRLGAMPYPAHMIRVLDPVPRDQDDCPTCGGNLKWTQSTPDMRCDGCGKTEDAVDWLNRR